MKKSYTATFKAQVVLELLKETKTLEFKHIVVILIRRNLKAVFDEEVDGNKVAEEFYPLIRGSWWYITELAKVLDDILGPAKASGAPRLITKAVIERLRAVWVQRTEVSHQEAIGGNGADEPAEAQKPCL